MSGDIEPVSYLKLVAVPDLYQVWHAALFSSEATARRFIAETAAPSEHDVLEVNRNELLLVLRELASQQVERVVLDAGSPQVHSGALADMLESLSAELD